MMPDPERVRRHAAATIRNFDWSKYGMEEPVQHEEQATWPEALADEIAISLFVGGNQTNSNRNRS